MTATTAPPPRTQILTSRPAGLWSTATVFRHGQCDPAGIVYTPQFFDVFNRAIEAWFCDVLGIDYYEILGPRRIGLGYVTAAAEFFLPCRMGDRIEIFPRVTRVGTTSYALTLHAMLGDQEALRGQFVTVTTCLETHRPIEIPQDIRQALVAYRERTNIAKA